MATMFSEIHQPKKETRGRKKLAEEDKKTKVIRFKTTGFEYEMLDYLRINTGYKSHGSMLYDMFLELINGDNIIMNFPGTSAERTQQDLRRIGKNLNQATASINAIASWKRNEQSTGRGLDALDKELKELRSIVEKMTEDFHVGFVKMAFNDETLLKLKAMEQDSDISEIAKKLKKVRERRRQNLN